VVEGQQNYSEVLVSPAGFCRCIPGEMKAVGEWNLSHISTQYRIKNDVNNFP
jgi:hypothetical protein